MLKLERWTTQYVELEDRMRLNALSSAKVTLKTEPDKTRDGLATICGTPNQVDVVAGTSGLQMPLANGLIALDRIRKENNSDSDGPGNPS